MNWLTALILFGTASSAGANERPTIDEFMSQVRACGVRDVTSRYDKDLHSEVVYSRDLNVSDRTLDCVIKARSEGGYLIIFSDEIETRYLQKWDWVNGAQIWLSNRELLDSVPDFDRSGFSDVDFALKLEMICGQHAKGMLSSAFGPRTSYLANVPFPMEPDIEEAVGCLVSASIVSGFEPNMLEKNFVLGEGRSKSDMIRRTPD